MTYDQLTQLLNPEQFKQMEVVRDLLIKDPTAMNKEPMEETGNGNKEKRT